MALMRRFTGAAPDEFGELAGFWTQGLAAPHEVGCGCGGMAPPTLDGAEIERDLLDYILGKYRHGAPEGLADFVRARRDHGDAEAFEQWLSALGGASLSEEARTRLVADLRVFLDSFAARGRPRVGVCY